jgi:nicotinamidase-related amidase
MEKLNAAKTALVLIDLQKGIMAFPTMPRASSAVLESATGLAKAFKKAGATVVLVKVDYASNFADALKQPVDYNIAPASLPKDWAEIPSDLAATGDVWIVKRQWGAFHGTELDLQLRRRGIDTIVLGGIATNLGVESTARAAWEHGYSVIFAEDATASLSEEMHKFSYSTIFPMLGRVSNTAAIAAALAH